MTPAQRAGQLVMVGMTTGGGAAVRRAITVSHVGSVYYAGGWRGSATVRAASAALQARATSAGSPGLLVAADQEGGEVQELRGSGFPAIASATAQAQMSAAARTAYAASFSRALRTAGLNLDLAPVADTVPAAIGIRNAPIGAFHREYGSDPRAVAGAVGDVVRGMRAAGVGATLKHFPGLGRITANTDTSSTGITDPVASVTDPHLRPFAAGIAAGAQAVMVSSARYPRLDARRPAVFSRAVITGLLRNRLGFGGLVITDDVHTPALAATPVGERAVRFVQAGGDVLLTAAPDLAPGLTRGLLTRMTADRAFAGVVEAAVRRVLATKARLGLLRCR
ncbi:glycoside hydrolase family 3 protein [Allobranchiibius sp. CTAmp26]|uniref:glycoside hydrolase family 3 protein n=1 Tax=Allobranchiibius sp. CTAmp26 TaxID=2815214 RepID=UPI001AA0CAB7|nr:glycoside hydrolase family 3 protein [Allobranchiibius sp. CTAmp26]MBO1754182.1 glycoside hydrolase family 3 protein [Allobranchiibius sp. CTAmp26]